MASIRSHTSFWRITLLVVGAWATLSNAILTQTLCSSQNTAATPGNSSIYQTLGNCQGFCQADYAYAIVQGDSCWCSSTTPANTVPVSQCNDKCIGYPFENCGNVGRKLFGYMALVIRPDTPTTSSTPSATTPITTEQVRTISGSVMTVTATIMPTGLSQGQGAPSTKKMSSGSIIAIAVAVVISAVVLLAAIIIGFCCWKRKKRAAYLEEADPTIPTRNVSVLSKAGLLGAAGSASNSDPNDRPGPMQERRNSKPLMTDQRLNPNAFTAHEGASATSFVSMEDNRDYTRTLNVRNPDPHPG